MHLAMAVVPVAGWWVSHQAALALAGLLVVASLAVEIARRHHPAVNPLLWRLLPSVFREWEDQGVLGSTWFAVAALAALLLYQRDVGGTAILFLAWGDPVAELAGHRWGGKAQGKTLAGSLCCFLACLLAAGVGAGLGGLSLWAVLAGAAVATLVERWPLPPDDNLWVPVISGLVMVGIGALV